MNILLMGIGIVSLVMGRKLFWFFVGAVGFVIGLSVAPSIFKEQPQTVILVIALAAGIVFALIAMALQKIAVSVAGFLAGGYIVNFLIQATNLNAGDYYWLVVFAGAILGALLVMSLFEWALIILTSAGGAILITDGFNLAAPFSLILFAVLSMVGIVTQGRIKDKE